MSSASQNRVIWHYMRTAPSDGSQELVAEHVEEGSKTDQFIQRAEKRRRSQECHRGIDMRGKTK
ncbi:hypothetical protein BOW53_06465 [Solemya pervernicosa gill symbiont]|uniref:Uncharacterized protein n=2 Tax=Gammaproteobacteria incertae sedis TaxID=118884 RepID=A0A1T2L6N4_9GAMM|nr:hypothetical protein [Solemya pervernicosa gill symbiont]OOZ40757.1 hypothetical protein BOW53_06465 [Solemya pervernicosa gill symbiont]